MAPLELWTDTTLTLRQFRLRHTLPPLRPDGDGVLAMVRGQKTKQERSERGVSDPRTRVFGNWIVGI